MQLFTRIFYLLREVKSSIGGQTKAAVVGLKDWTKFTEMSGRSLPNKLAEVHRNGWTKLTE
jgi:hypothetical protein